MALTLKPFENHDEREQGELFGPSATVHDVVQAKGVKGAVAVAQIAALASKVPSLPKVLAGRMGKQIADTASQAIVREFEGAGERGYTYSAWCLTGLPHRELPPGKNWLIETDFARLLVRPGVRLCDDNSEDRLHSLPKETFITWDRLWRQFGSRVGLLKNFRPQFEGPLHLALSAYKQAKVRVQDRGLLLEPSPVPIAR